jgi:hypothetical protein
VEGWFDQATENLFVGETKDNRGVGDEMLWNSN